MNINVSILISFKKQKKCRRGILLRSTSGQLDHTVLYRDPGRVILFQYNLHTTAYKASGLQTFNPKLCEASSAVDAYRHAWWWKQLSAHPLLFPLPWCFRLASLILICKVIRYCATWFKSNKFFYTFREAGPLSLSLSFPLLLFSSWSQRLKTKRPKIFKGESLQSQTGTESLK